MNLDSFCFELEKIVQKHDLLPNQGRILVSVSGGVDSLCLLLSLAPLCEKRGIEPVVVHFNHGIRQQSDEEQAFVEALASKQGFDCVSIKANELFAAKGVQAKARAWRRQHLIEIAVKKNAKAIALGHHLDDLVETQLWRILRGGSLFSLAPMKIKDAPWIRPLLFTPKKSLIDWLKTKSQPWM